MYVQEEGQVNADDDSDGDFRTVESRRKQRHDGGGEKKAAAGSRSARGTGVWTRGGQRSGSQRAGPQPPRR